MAFKLPEMVQGTSTITGAGDYPITTTTANFRSPSDEGMVDGDTTFGIFYDAASPPKYAEYIVTYRTGSPRFERTTFLRSSTGSDIVWGAGTVTFVLGLPGMWLANLLDPSLGSGYVKRTAGTPPTYAGVPVVPLTDGGTGATAAPAARTNLGALDRALTENTIMTANGDLITRLLGVPIRMPIGAVGTFLRSSGTLPLWAVPSSPEISFDNTVAALAGSPATVYAAINALDAAVDLIPFRKGSYVSAQQTITAGGSLTLAHGLTVKPYLVLAFLVNVTGEGGYSTNDEVNMGGGTAQSANGNRGHSIWTDTTNVNVRFGSGAQTYDLLRKDTGVGFTITNANWKIYFVAMA